MEKERRIMRTNNNYEILVKGGFSERKGIKHFSNIIQVNYLKENFENKEE